MVILLFAVVLGLLMVEAKPSVKSDPHSANTCRNLIPPVALGLAAAAGFAVLALVRRDLLQLGLLFSRIDFMAFGGGFASLPLMFREVVEIRGWVDAPMFMNGIALGQLTPGPIVITATFVGYLVHGLPGALVATLAVFFPSFLVLVGVAPWFDRLRSNPWVSRAMSGLLGSFVGLLLTVTIRLALHIHWDWLHLLVAAALAALLAKVDILWVVIAGIAVSASAF